MSIKNTLSVHRQLNDLRKFKLKTIRETEQLKPFLSSIFSKTDGILKDPKPTLEFANICLSNALTLVERYEVDFQLSQDLDEGIGDGSSTSFSLSASASTSSSVSTPDVTTTPTPSGTSPEWAKINEKQHCPPSRPLTNETFEKLKSAVLAATSYVEISLCEFVLGLKHARELKKMPNLPDTYA